MEEREKKKIEGNERVDSGRSHTYMSISSYIYVVFKDFGSYMYKNIYVTKY